MTAPGRVHIVGAGLAGLAAAVALVGRGRPATLYEAGRHAGGRCRSFADAELGCRIDNGNHLLLAGNRAALSYLERTGALGTLEGPLEARIPFFDLASGESWALRPNRGGLPWWILVPARRVPGTRARDYLEALKLRRAAADATIAERLDAGTVLFRRLWQPLAVAALNTGVDDASARLFWRVLVETLGRGGEACRPLAPREGLSESFVDPALAWLTGRGAAIRFGARLRAFDFSGERVSNLVFDEGAVALAAGDSVILASPASVAARLVPGLTVPQDHAPIVNAHFRCAPPGRAPLLLGIIGGTAEWVFRKREILSVTVSAADRIADRPAEELKNLLWREIARACRLPAAPIPPARIVKERRATFRATPDQLKRRPPTATRWANLVLAGDYVDTGLPATIEGAIRSGFAAAQAVGRNRSLARASVEEGAGKPATGILPATIGDRGRAL